MEGETVGLKSAEKDVEKGVDHGEYNVDNVVEGDKDVKTFQIDKTETYCGLKKEDLLKYSKDPYWVRLRIILLVIFCVIWVAMLVAAIVIIVLTPKCPPRPSQEWWETAMIYCIQPKSFSDSNEDGVGDLNGIHSKLDYIKDTVKADAISLGVMQQSPQKTVLGMDVSDYIKVSTEYGNAKDFEDLRAAVHKKAMRLILDFVPNHSSDEHPWFKASKNKTEPFKDFYLWHPGVNGAPPNGLTNVYGEVAWTFDTDRKEFYYHSYSKHEPDFDLSNGNVVARLDEAILYWLKLKVDGIKILGASHLVESKSIFNETITNPVSRQNTINLINHWRQLLDNHTNSETQRSQPQIRVLLVDLDEVPANLSDFFGKKGSNGSAIGAHLPINKELLKFNSSCKASCLSALIHGWFDSIGQTSRHSNWMFTDHTASRIASRLDGNVDILNAVNLMMLALPGASFVYYGDEIGMRDVTYNTSLSEGSTSYSSGPKMVSFGPMQWSDQPNAGFTQDHPWLHAGENYPEVNVESQLAHGSGMSKVKVFSRLAALRKEPSVQWGRFKAATSKNIYYYLRAAEGHPSILVALNLGPSSSTVSLRKGKLGENIPKTMATILASTYNFEGLRAEIFSDGTEVDLDTAILLQPGEGVALKWTEERSIL